MAQSASSNIVGVHYKVGKKIGEGSFGIIFEGLNVLNNQSVAIKFEPRKCEAPQLRDEYRLYRVLSLCHGIPHAYFFGQEGVHNILVIDLLGPSLEDLFDWCSRRFTAKTVIQVAKQMIERVELIHSQNLIYRDIKPDNFLIAHPNSPDPNTINVVDFGMAKHYRDPRTRLHIPYRDRKALSGTARYMLINTHLGREQLRRDDLESLGHVFMYFLRGSLPWQGLKAPTNKQKYEKIGSKKQTTNITELCRGYPIQFAQYLTYARNLKFDETPDYQYLYRLMDQAMRDIGGQFDDHYDWLELNGGRGWDTALNKKVNLHGYGQPNPPQPALQKSAPQQASTARSALILSQAHQSQSHRHPLRHTPEPSSSPNYPHSRNENVNTPLLPKDGLADQIRNYRSLSGTYTPHRSSTTKSLGSQPTLQGPLIYGRGPAAPNGHESSANLIDEHSRDSGCCGCWHKTFCCI